jgi:hypothetical protein
MATDFKGPRNPVEDGPDEDDDPFGDPRSNDDESDYLEEFTPYDYEAEPYRGPIITTYYNQHGKLEGTCFQDEPGGITDCQ